MASIWLDPRTDNYLIKFHFGGKRFTRSCQTQKEGAANLLKARVEETISLLNTGRLVMPEDTPDPGTWIISGGKVQQKPKLPSAERARLAMYANRTSPTSGTKRKRHWEGSRFTSAI